MKIVKSSIFAVAVAMFITSCGSSEPQEAVEVPATEEVTEMEEAPIMEEAPVADTTMAPVEDTTVMN